MASDFRDDSFDADESDFDVVIVGGGLTGLITANYILQKRTGISVLVLEGNDSVGGRLLTPEENDAFHAHPLQKNITELINVLQIDKEPRREINGRHGVYYANKGPTSKELPRHVAEQIRGFMKTIHATSKHIHFGSYGAHHEAEELAKISVDTLLCRLVFFPQALSFCRGLIVATCGIKHIGNISALWFLVMLNGAGGLLRRLRIALGDEKRYFVKGGMTSVTEELVRRIRQEGGKISCAQPVVKIQFNDYRTYVSANQGIYKCDYVIIAVPPPENALITIDPPLPDKLLESQRLYEHGDSVFFISTYERPFWCDKFFTGDVLCTPDSGVNLMLAYDATHPQNKRQSIIAGLLPEPDLTTTKIKLCSTLDSCYQANEAFRHIKHRERIWKPHDFFETKDGTGGGGSPMSAMKRSRIFYHVNSMFHTHGRVLFAASEYARNWPGTIDGAVEAGQYAACKVLMYLRPQALNLMEISTSTWPMENPKEPAAPIETTMIHFVLLLFNITIFYSFLRVAYKPLV